MAERLDGDFAGLHAGICVGRTEIGDAVAVRRIAVGGEQRHLRGNAVERVDRGFRINRRNHDGIGAGGDEVIHQGILQRRRALRRIFELKFVVRQFALRLLHAGFGQFPEIRSGIDDESQLLLLLGLNSRCQSKRYGC